MIAILILAHLIYLGRVLDAFVKNKATVYLSSSLLTLLCWNVNITWGIVTLVVTFIIFLGLLFKE